MKTPAPAAQEACHCRRRAPALTNVPTTVSHAAMPKAAQSVRTAMLLGPMAKDVSSVLSHAQAPATLEI